MHSTHRERRHQAPGAAASRERRWTQGGLDRASYVMEARGMVMLRAHRLAVLIREAGERPVPMSHLRAGLIADAVRACTAATRQAYEAERACLPDRAGPDIDAYTRRNARLHSASARADALAAQFAVEPEEFAEALATAVTVLRDMVAAAEPPPPS
ncbi:hypothetical protein [Yinghuangia seranimata]|uniref:hypothetical protein n=1 Tax=Yinghuangia seranimata TaxID=408067 RepID=UPI00248B6C09|nr:hypothetical protein [Yinghuangia seranimata]MDI2129863.1 hypothetical protein [Yinghuangia seranimata]